MTESNAIENGLAGPNDDLAIDEGGEVLLTKEKPDTQNPAFTLAKAGFHIFPLPPGRKFPPPKDWQKIATTDPERIKRWTEVGNSDLTNAAPNFGIALTADQLVVDIDPRNGGDESLAALERQYGPFPATRTALTPGGGKHLYFSVPSHVNVANNNNGKLGNGIDLKTRGGYVLAPPSTISDKGAYVFEGNTAIAEMPAWLIEQATRPRAPKTESSAPVLSQETLKHEFTLGDARELFKYLDPNSDYETWFNIVVATRRAAQGAQDSSTETDWLNLVDAWSSRSPKYQDRHDVVAKWAETDKRPHGFRLRYLIELAKAAGYKPPARQVDHSAFEPIAEPSFPAPHSNVEPSTSLPELEFLRLRDGLYSNPPLARAFALGGYLPKGIASKFSGPGQLGKSMIMVYAALCQAVGREFCGHACAPGRVVYLSAEDEFEEFERRMHRLLHMVYPQGLPPAVERLLGENFRGVDLVANGTDCLLTNINRQGRVAITPFVQHVTKQIGSAELVIFDTQSRFNGGPENDNTAGAVFIRALELIAKSTGAAVCAISHVGKGKDSDSGQYDRGASALTDNARGAMKLTLVPVDDRRQLTDPDQLLKIERGDIVRLIHAKNSYGPRNKDAYFERGLNGVLLPVVLTLNAAAGPSAFEPKAVDLVRTLLVRVAAAGEVSRNQVRDSYQEWCGPTASRKNALQAFDTAEREGWLEFARNHRRAALYRVVANADLVGGPNNGR